MIKLFISGNYIINYIIINNKSMLIMKKLFLFFTCITCLFSCSEKKQTQTEDEKLTTELTEDIKKIQKDVEVLVDGLKEYDSKLLGFISKLEDKSLSDTEFLLNKSDAEFYSNMKKLQLDRISTAEDQLKYCSEALQKRVSSKINIVRLESAEVDKRLAQVLGYEVDKNAPTVAEEKTPVLEESKVVTETKKTLTAKVEAVKPDVSVRKTVTVSEAKMDKISSNNRPKIAIIIDDVMSYSQVKDLAGTPMTLAFMSYANGLSGEVDKANQNGFESIGHLVMEAQKYPHTGQAAADELRTDWEYVEDLEKKIDTILSKYAGSLIVGFNNHTGSRFTEDHDSMSILMRKLKINNSFFYDSKTTMNSIGEKVAKEEGVPYISRDIFLDNERNEEYILSRLGETGELAKKRFSSGISKPVVVTAHATPVTVKTLSNWLLQNSNNYEFVYVRNHVN